MAYCDPGAATAALAQYTGHIQPHALLAEATAALDALRGLITAHAARGAVALLVAGSGFRAAALSAERDVERCGPARHG